MGSSSVEAEFDDELSVDCEDDILDREIDPAEISRCLTMLKHNKTGGSDGLVGEFNQLRSVIVQ